MMLVILDRDGVINEESPHFIKSPEEWLPIPGSLAAIARLKRAGFEVAVATNQSGVGRGFYSEEMLHQIHLKMTTALSEHDATFDGIFYCPHAPWQQCDCRKPAPALFYKIAKNLHQNVFESICIGDSLRDIEAALCVGAKPILVLTGNGQVTKERLGRLTIPVYRNLADAVEEILLGY